MPCKGPRLGTVNPWVESEYGESPEQVTEALIDKLGCSGLLHHISDIMELKSKRFAERGEREGRERSYYNAANRLLKAAGDIEECSFEVRRQYYL